jgi:hypothetical protein
MGCCPTGSAGRKRQKDTVIDPQRVKEIKERLKAERLNASSSPYSDETVSILRKAKAQPFNCRFIGLLFVHNYLMFLRDKSGGIIKDSSQLSLLDIRGSTSAQFHDTERVFKSTWFDLAAFMRKYREGKGGDNIQSRDQAQQLIK